MKTFRDYISEGGIEPVKPVVRIQPQFPKKKQDKKPLLRIKPIPSPIVPVPVRTPDEFIPTPSRPDFKPYTKNP